MDAFDVNFSLMHFALKHYKGRSANDFIKLIRLMKLGNGWTSPPTFFMIEIGDFCGLDGYNVFPVSPVL